MQAALSKPTAIDMLASITPAETSLLFMRSAIFGIKLKRKMANARDCAITATSAQIAKSTTATEFEAALPRAIAKPIIAPPTFPIVYVTDSSFTSFHSS